jgi:hypothetical protein
VLAVRRGNGVMEYWNDGVLGLIFQYSTTPVLHHSDR